MEKQEPEALQPKAVPVPELPALTEERKLVPCPQCRELVDAKAKLCRHCKSDLSWKRYFTISQTTLAIATALVAVIGAVLPQLKAMLTKPDSVPLAITLIGSTSETASFLVSNYGPKNVFFEFARISDKKKDGWYVRFQQPGHRLIQPNTTVTIEATAVEAWVGAAPNFSPTQCEMSASFSDAESGHLEKGHICIMLARIKGTISAVAQLVGKNARSSRRATACAGGRIAQRSVGENGQDPVQCGRSDGPDPETARFFPEALSSMKDGDFPFDFPNPQDHGRSGARSR